LVDAGVGGPGAPVRRLQTTASDPPLQPQRGWGRGAATAGGVVRGEGGDPRGLEFLLGHCGHRLGVALQIARGGAATPVVKRRQIDNMTS